MRGMLLAVGLFVIPWACGGDDGGGLASNTGGGGASGGGSGTGGSPPDASPTGGNGGLGLDAADSPADACVAETVEATVTKLPVDVVVVVDTSPTMSPVSDAVEANINNNLAQVLTTSGIDYRLIVLAGYGSGAELCVGPPLGGASCASPPPAPANTSTFFHYPAATGSGAFLANILAWYNQPDPLGTAPSGWSAWLRPGARRVFVAITDTSSTSTLTGAQFDSQLLALTPKSFGTAAAREYTFHSIIGLAENSPATKAWAPTDPVVNGTCSGPFSVGAGQPLQEVSVLTGGLRFPICQYQSFDTVFQALAKEVVQFTPLACDMPFPKAPSGKTIDPNTIQLTYTPAGGTPELFQQVKSQAECVAGSFWVESQTIHLCPGTCAKINAAPGGSLSVKFGCDVGFVK